MSSIKTSKGKFKYNNKILYLGIKQIDKIQALENLKLLATILDEKKLHWEPAYGSLLGIIRDNDFIEWDEDIDLYILEEEEQLFRDSLWDLKNSGFQLIRYERRGLYSIIRNGEYIDFYVLQKLTNNLRETKGGGYMLEKHLTDRIQIDFKGVNLFAPKDYDEYLSLQYGDWRTPVQYANFKKNTVMRFVSKIPFFIKNHLPDCIYFPLLKFHHRKDLRKYIERCERYGVKI